MKQPTLQENSSGKLQNKVNNIVGRRSCYIQMFLRVKHQFDLSDKIAKSI